MTDNKAYRVASANLYGRNFGDEVLIVDTESGRYFSLRGCAVDIWSLIESGATVNDIIAELGRRYDGAAEEIGAAVHRCLGDLVGNDLVREAEAGSGEMLVSAGSTPRQSLAAPVVERFTDMENLLLLDPIHNVSDMGWPRPALPPLDDTSSSR
jgi:Coenzyme PQQ synthesis protein D (PqqD)